MHKSRDGVCLFCQPNIHICSEHIVLFLRNMFKFLGHSQFLEFFATSKEVVLFYDHGFVLLRFACGFDLPSINGSRCDVMVTEKINVYPGLLVIAKILSSAFFGFSLLALFMMSVDRYLATHYPLFRRASVTKGKLLTLFIFLSFIQISVIAMSINDLVIAFLFCRPIFSLLFILPILFINYKLLTVTRKSRTDLGISPAEMKKSFSLKKYQVACL